jgi:hypothetical protein
MRMLLFTCLLLIVSCASPQNTSEIKAAEPPPKMDASEKIAEPGQNTVVEEKAGNSKPGIVDFSCNTASDCAIKDIGSCCGHYPACVNKDSPTFPEQVKAECEKSGMMSTCGFPSISSCTCTDNKCRGVTGAMAEESLQ